MLSSAPAEAAENIIPTRIGLAKLTRMSFDGIDLAPLWGDLLQRVAQDGSNTAAIMDMSVIAQLLGDQSSGLALQEGALNVERLYRSPCSTASPRLRVLALAAATDIGGNTPLECLLEETDLEIYTLYIVPGLPLPNPLPAHDIAIVVAPDSQSTSTTLSEIDRLVRNWPRPVLNLPQNICALERDRLHVLLQGVSGIHIPMTVGLSRQQFLDIAHNGAALRDFIGEGKFPLIVRPVYSHAGR